MSWNAFIMSAERICIRMPLHQETPQRSSLTIPDVKHLLHCETAILRKLLSLTLSFVFQIRDMSHFVHSSQTYIINILRLIS